MASLSATIKSILNGTKNPAPTTSEMKTALGTLYDFVTELLGTDSSNKAAARTALGALSTGYVHMRDQKANGTPGGSSVTAGWLTRTLNTEAADTANLASVTTNQIMLAAGTYRFHARAPAYSTKRHRLRLRNVSTNTTIAVGGNAYSENTGDAVTDAVVFGVFTIAAAQTLELQHYTEIAQASTGLGIPTSTGDVEVFAEIEFWKE